jgi:hypothetical protein
MLQISLAILCKRIVTVSLSAQTPTAHHSWRIIGTANVNAAFESAEAVCSLSKPCLNRFWYSQPTPYSMRSSSVLPVVGIRLDKTCRESRAMHGQGTAARY